METQEATRQHRWESGQSLVEMTLGLMFFLVVLLGVLDLGRLYFIYIAMEDGANEAALYLALNASCPEPDAGECADPNNARYRAAHASSQFIDFSWDQVTINHEFLPATETTEAMVRVSLTYPFRLLAPIITEIVGSDAFVLRAEATHVRIAD